MIAYAAFGKAVLHRLCFCSSCHLQGADASASAKARDICSAAICAASVSSSPDIWRHLPGRHSSVLSHGEVGERGRPGWKHHALTTTVEACYVQPKTPFRAFPTVLTPMATRRARHSHKQACSQSLLRRVPPHSRIPVAQVHKTPREASHFLPC